MPCPLLQRRGLVHRGSLGMRGAFRSQDHLWERHSKGSDRAPNCHAASYRFLHRCRSEGWRVIAFFSVPESRSLESAANTVVDALGECADSFVGEVTFVHVPKCITVFGEYVFYLGKSQTAGRCQTPAFELGTIAAAAMFSDLFSHVRINTFGARPSQAELDTVLQSLEPQAFWSKDVQLKE